MKLLTIAALLISLSASAERTFHKNDGSAKSGNPGTFTKEDANTIKGYKGTTTQGSSSIQSGETSGVPDSKPLGANKTDSTTETGTGATSDSEEKETLDMSTAPEAKRSLPSGDKVLLDEEEEE